MSFLIKIKGIWLLIRFELPFSAGICVVMGQLLAQGHFAGLIQTLSGFAAVFFISAAILVLNDYIDVETDKVNAPLRPIPANLVSPNEALILSVILFSGGIVLSYSLGIATLWLAIILIVVGMLYNRVFKKSGLPGNLMVSFSVGMTFVFGALSVGQPFSVMAWFFAVIASLIDLGEEIAADAMDMEGDRLIQSNSLAIRFGAERAIKISVNIFFLVILLTMLPFFMQWFGLIYLIPIIVMDLTIAYSAFRLLRCQGQEGRKYIRLLYLGASAGILLFVIMRFFIAD